MRIPNKFNGYSRDGIRLYNDPATAAAIAAAGTSTGTMAGATLMATGATAGTTAAIASNMALASGMNLGSNLYNAGSGLASLTGSGVDQAAFLQNQIAATTPTAPTGIASNFNAPNYLANLQTPVTAPVATPFQTEMSASVLNSPALNPTAQITPTVNATPEMLNATKVYEAARPVYPQGIESLAQGRGFPAVESITAPPVAAPTVPTKIASGYTANPYIAQHSVVPSPVAPTTVTAPPVAAPASPVAEVVAEAPARNTLLDPIISEPGTSPVKLIETPAGGDVVTMGGNTVKPGMTGNAYDDAKTLFSKPNWENIKGFASEHPYLTGAAGLGAYQLLKPKAPEYKKTPSHIRPYSNTRAVSPTANYYTPYSGESTAERNYFTGGLQALPIYEAAEGGITSLAVGGPIETMAAMNAVGENLGYPQSQYQTDIYSNPNVQRPQTMDMIAPSGDVPVDQYTGEQKFAKGGDTGEYKYSYDPKTQQFTQLNDPVADAAQKAAVQMSNPSGGLGGIYNYGMQTPPVVAPKPFTPVVTGGIAQPMQQAAAQAPVQQAPAPAPIPAYQTPEQQLGLGGFYDYMNQQLGGMRGYQGFAEGGLSHLGGYSDGGRLLRGPGDGVSDSIPASIGDRQPARLADGEFVVPARIVSELGNGSTDAGARKLYAMMQRIQQARGKTVGNGKVAVNSKADKLLPA